MNRTPLLPVVLGGILTGFAVVRAENHEWVLMCVDAVMAGVCYFAAWCYGRDTR